LEEFWTLVKLSAHVSVFWILQAEFACYFELSWWTSRVCQIKKLSKRLDGHEGGLAMIYLLFAMVIDEIPYLQNINALWNRLF